MKKIIFLIILIISCFYVNAGTIFEENFDTNISFSGWSFSNGACGYDVGVPVNSIFGSYGFGILDYNHCGFGYTRQLGRNLPVNITSDILYFYYDYALLNNTIDNNNRPLIIILSNETYNSGHDIQFKHRNDKFDVESTFLNDFVSCSFNITENPIGINYPYNFTNGKIIINLETMTYSWEINGYIICNEVSYGTDLTFEIVGISLYEQLDSGEQFYSIIDNIEITTTDYNTTKVSVGYPCEIDNDCITGFCSAFQCRKKQGLSSCAENYECLSGICSKGKCVEPSLFLKINEVKETTVGNDENTNNLIAISVSLILLFWLAGLGVKNQSRALIIGSVLVFYVSMFFFLLIGWLSFIIGFILFLVTVVAFMFLSIVGHSGE